MAGQKYFMRYASPNEQRTISREDLNLYHAVIIGAVYEFRNNLSLTSPQSYFYPLKCCIEEHPFLRVIVGDKHANRSFFQWVPSINLEDHITILDNPSNNEKELDAIEKVLAQDLDAPFPANIPPWRILVLPLDTSRCFIAYSFSHTIGDGPCGPAFHRTFLRALRSSPERESSVSKMLKTPVGSLPAPFDTRERLPVSWSFLLAPLIGYYLPPFIAKFLGLRASFTVLDEGTWTGAAVAFDESGPHTKMKLREIEAPLLEKSLRLARNHDARFTGMILQFLVRALSQVVPDSSVTNFISQIAINMRRSTGVSNDVISNLVSVCSFKHPRVDPSTSTIFSDESWMTASQMTKELSERASTLQDQPIALLRYLSSIRKWFTNRLGRRRDVTFEVSNVGAFAPSDQEQEFTDVDRPAVTITKAAFAQPGHMDGPPLEFNFIAIKGGSLMYTVSWQRGALGIAEADEEEFVDKICLLLRSEFENLK